MQHYSRDKRQTKITNSTTKSTMRFYKYLIICVAIALCSCNAQRNVLYLQDAYDGTAITLPEDYLIRIKPNDKLNIIVNSLTPELSLPFNSSSNYNSLTGSTQATSYNDDSIQSIVVAADGSITMPILGRIECAGLTREELASKIEQLITEGGYLTDPQVNVTFVDLTLSIVGEVTRPGRYNISKDHITIFEALALAGDMTIYGNRANVAVVREINGQNIITRLDLRSDDVFASPCFYLEQNDIIIVSPNKYRAATAEINQNRSFWISIASTAISLATLMLTLFR